jgi:hypothetical protein
MTLRNRLLVALVAAVLLAPVGAATHMRNYAQFFVEHDDQGRSDEPDFASTGVLGRLVANCVADLTPADPGCIPDGALGRVPGQAEAIAPGCTDDTGRRPSGMCGMWTIGIYHSALEDPSLATPPGVVGVQGMSGNAAPGRLSASKGTIIRFMDIQTNLQEIFPGFSGSQYHDYNRKLEDSGARALLSSLDPNLGGRQVAGSTGVWAWYGTWKDSNGNGVIDHLGDHLGNTEPGNEFVWVGKCIQFNGSPAPPGQQYCKEEPASVFPVWMWPGNHHALCGGTLPPPVPTEMRCHAVPADFPGHQPVCFVDVLSEGLLPVFCDGDLSTFDFTDEGFFGDPIFGTQHHVWPDGFMGDRTGDVNIGSRQWIYGGGWSTRFYDQGTVVRLIVMGGPTTQGFNPEDRNKVPYDLARFHSFDVDFYTSLSPMVGDLLEGQLKPAARANWVTVRDNFVPVQNSTDGVRHNRALDTSGTTQGVDDAFINPGFSREPNTRFDQYPAARFDVFAPSTELSVVEQRHRGWLNDYSAHRDAWRVFGDATMTRLYHTSLAWRNPQSGTCLPSMCATGGGTFSSNQYLSPAANAEHQRTMEPGMWVVGGFAGVWRDTAQKVLDEVVDLEATLAAGAMRVTREQYVVPHDGWLGNIVNTTGTWKYRGYPGPSDPDAPECTIAGAKAKRYFAECNPYWSGTTFDASPYAGPFQDTGVDIENPQAGGGGEFVGLFPARSISDQKAVRVYPAGPNGDCNSIGTWTVPVMTWSTFETWTIGDTTAIRDHTGTSGAAAVIVLPAGIGAGVGGPNALVLPHGNLGLTVCTELREVVKVNIPERGISVTETLRDVDVFVPWA